MAPFDDTTAKTRFDSFNVYRTSYKQIGDHKIEVGILVPKNLKPGKHPLLVKFHGGGLVTGTALYPDWFAAWFVPFIHRNNAITVLPNYRLTPEHTGDEILEDLADFWKWFYAGGVADFLKSQNVQVDLDYAQLLVSGESAGGYMAIQSGLTRPEGEIKAILTQYPMTEYLRREPSDEVWPGSGVPAPAPSIIDEHMKTVEKGSVVSSVTPPARSDISYALSAYGRYNEFFGKGKHLWPISAIEDAQFLPPTVIIHGDADQAVDTGDTAAFVKKAAEVLPEAEIKFLSREGADHGFDVEMKEDEEPWLKEGLKWIESKWLA